QPLAEESQDLLERRRRRSEPQLPAGLELNALLRQHPGQLGYLQGPLASVGGRDPNNDDLVSERAICQGRRLPLQRARGLVLIPLSESSIHELDATGGDGDLPGLRL